MGSKEYSHYIGHPNQQKSSNGRKIARIGPISTIFGPNESSRRNLFLKNFRKKETNEKILKKKSLGRRERFRPKIVKIGAIPAIFRPFEDLQDLEGHHETCEMQIWRGSEFLKVTIRSVSKNYPISPENQFYTIFGKGVNRSIKIFGFEFWLKPTYSFLDGMT